MTKIEASAQKKVPYTYNSYASCAGVYAYATPAFDLKCTTGPVAGGPVKSNFRHPSQLGIFDSV